MTAASSSLPVMPAGADLVDRVAITAARALVRFSAHRAERLHAASDDRDDVRRRLEAERDRAARERSTGRMLPPVHR